MLRQMRINQKPSTASIESDIFWNIVYAAYNELQKGIIIIELRPDHTDKRICYMNAAAMHMLYEETTIDMRGTPITKLFQAESQIDYENLVKTWRTDKTTSGKCLFLADPDPTPMPTQHDFVLQGDQTAHQVTASLAFMTKQTRVMSIMLIIHHQKLDVPRRPRTYRSVDIARFYCPFFRQKHRIMPQQTYYLHDQEINGFAWSTIYWAYNKLNEAMLIVDISQNQRPCICFANTRAERFLNGFDIEYTSSREGLRGRLITDFMHAHSQATYHHLIDDKITTPYELVLKDQSVTLTASFLLIQDKLMHILFIEIHDATLVPVKQNSF